LGALGVDFGGVALRLDRTATVADSFRGEGRGAAMAGVAITTVVPGSVADRLGLRPADRLVAINGHPLRDALDLAFYGALEELDLVVHRDGEESSFLLEKDPGVALGVEVEAMEVQRCKNNCLFCFVYQNRPRQRRSLYVKDEDYRFSFLHGHYITLSNLTEADWARIFEQRLSPLYISVHATDPALRDRLLRNRTPQPVLPKLRRLVDGGIELHTQVVVCPGLNDGAQLSRTLLDLAAFHPGVRSVAVVPVGLTDHRRRLPRLRSADGDDARSLLDLLGGLQGWFRVRLGTRFCFAADEWYLLAGREMPDADHYEGYPQIADGVGGMARFAAELDDLITSGAARPPAGDYCFFTGQLFAPALTRHVAELQGRYLGWRGRVVALENRYLGSGITVAGLLAGEDVRRGLAQCGAHEVPVIPRVMVEEDGATFLDGVTVEELRAECHPGLTVVAADAQGLLVPV